jgi:hypothetical protein
MAMDTHANACVEAVVQGHQRVAPCKTEDEVARTYVAGLNSGLASNLNTEGSVYITGPLAVAISSPAPYGSHARALSARTIRGAPRPTA